MTERLATAAARRPGLTIAAWIAGVLVSLVLIVFLLGGNMGGRQPAKQATGIIGNFGAKMVARG